MRKGFIVIFLVISFSISAQNYALKDVQDAQNIEFTKSIISTLTNPYFEGRDIRRKSIYRTQMYLENILRSYNIKAYFNYYRVPYNLKDTQKGYNLVGLYRGNYRTKEAILLMANYDNLGILGGKTSEDSLYQGANDNASGVAALIQMAVFFSKVKPRENIIYALTSGKHTNMVGAGFLADTIQKDSFLRINYAINLEMLGKPMPNSQNNLLSIQDTAHNLTKLLNEYIDEDFLSIELSKEFKDRSEHTPIFNVLRVPTATLTSFNLANDENYMTTEDKIQNIDIDYLHRTTARITLAVYELIKNRRMVSFQTENEEE